MRIPHTRRNSSSPLRDEPEETAGQPAVGSTSNNNFRNKTTATPPPLRPRAFLEDAMDRWGDTVYRVALAHTGSPADADDVYQDVFLRLIKDTTSFASDEHMKAWLLRVTINRSHDLTRSSWNRRTTSLELQHTDIAGPSPFRADVWEVVGTLPPDQRDAVHLFYVEGYSTDEIACIAGCQPATVRTRLHRARERLRETLSPCESDAHIIEFRKENPDVGTQNA